MNEIRFVAGRIPPNLNSNQSNYLRLREYSKAAKAFSFIDQLYGRRGLLEAIANINGTGADKLRAKIVCKKQSHCFLVDSGFC
jgi:hypothetical protein